VVILHHQDERRELGAAREDRDQRVQELAAALGRVDTAGTGVVRLAVQMNEEGCDVGLDIGTQGGESRRQAHCDLASGLLLRAADKLPEQGGDQEVRNGRGARGGFHPHDAPRTSFQPVEHLVHEARLPHAGVGDQSGRLRLTLPGPHQDAGELCEILLAPDEGGQRPRAGTDGPGRPVCRADEAENLHRTGESPQRDLADRFDLGDAGNQARGLVRQQDRAGCCPLLQPCRDMRRDARDVVVLVVAPGSAQDHWATADADAHGNG